MRTKILELEWDDHAFYGGEDGGPASGISRQVSIGYLVLETDEYIKIAQSLTDGRPNECVVVDKRMLRKRRVVRG